MSRLHLPAPLPLLAPLREPVPDRCAITYLPRHRLRITIDHEPLAGITPEMLLWWFQHIGGTMTYLGDTVTRYRAWHPFDHIHWELDREARGGGVGEGARFRIVEALGRDERYYIDTVDTVEKLDATGIRLVLRVLGAQVFQLEHTWSHAADATHYTSVMDVGGRAAWTAPINRHLRRRVFVPGMERAWITHNVEEVGLLEHILPPLYAQHVSSD